jgi:uncharacterized protein DUF3576
MCVRYYGPLLGLAASLSLTLAGCGSDPPAPAAADRVAGPAALHSQPNLRQAKSEVDNTDETLWTWLGIAKRPSHEPGPQTGATVNPVLWQATLDTFGFAGFGSEDPVTGLLVTKWYSPPSNPQERLRVSVFILSRVLRSDAMAITVERQVRDPSGAWTSTPVAKEVVSGLENAILDRARHIHAERYRDTYYK